MLKREWFEGVDDAALKEFVEYDRANKEIWPLFFKFALEAKKGGRKRYSAKGIMERIRWECEIGGANSGKFKVNNNFTAFYVRALCGMYPQFKGFFETRTLGRVRSDQEGGDGELFEAA